ncbi:MAG: RecQ family ATP-dependent DNA helicase [Prevotella sp.]|nr:RecQ family ATP-dependent DNA helicase [Prevotella sp.]
MDRYLEILRNNWGFTDFRGIQKDIIASIGSGRDTLGLMPTGGGKSITFQVPALAKEGVCIVITPLIALMKDQVQHLRRKGIQAAAIYSGMSRSEIIVCLENCIFGGVKILYVSPERIGSELFKQKLRRINVSFITVDEAHCISQWGYDFRPSYLHITDLRKLKPNAPVLALTATATPEVTDDIQRQLGFEKPNVFRMSFERKNLAYIVRTAPDKHAELKHILRSVNGSAIVYVRSRKRTKEIAELLQSDNISATYYHAGLEHSTKDLRQEAWQHDKVRVMVATNAFGMGIDKPDVRLVIHLDCPSSPESYFQEAGRAGRDGLKSYAVLLYNSGDTPKLHKRISENFPPKEYVRKVYDHLAYYYQIAAGSGYGHTFTFKPGEFCHYFKHHAIQLNSALHILERAGYIEYEEDPDAAARLMFLLERDDLYRLEQLSPLEEKVITTILRLYSGVFSEYCYIDEGLIAQKAGLQTNTVYQVLRGLSHQRVISFIPQRKMPLITYLQDREEGSQIVLPKAVYEDRKAQYGKRIEAMVNYATCEDICRSSFLLNYFGEDRGADYQCGQCDVCIGKKQPRQAAASAEEQVMKLLADGKGHRPSELKSLGIPTERLSIAIENLRQEQCIIQSEGRLYKA